MAAKKFLSGIDLAQQKLVNMADGSVASDAATYGQVLNLVNGLDFKASVRVTSTANVTVTAPGTTLDGVTLVNGDRVLLKNQTTASENGVYQFNGSAAAMTRTSDAVQGELTAGATVVVTEGTNKGTGSASANPTQWTLATVDPITVGTTALTFNQSGAPGTTYTPGNGITITSGSIAVNPIAGGGVSVAPGGVSVDHTKVPMIFAANVGDGSTTSVVVTHGLGTRDVQVTLYDSGSDAEVDVDVVHTSTTTVTLNFATAPASNAYRVVIFG
jgi:hypothetical protein